MNSLTDELPLSANFDCVLMLTWSNWHGEMRSNRYHYATRFAQHLPVIFVQADLEEVSFKYETTEVDNLVILHVWQSYLPEQSELLNLALLERRLIKPLLWIYNPLFIDFITQRYSPLKVYHATEDYFKNQCIFDKIDDFILDKLKQVINHVNLLISVSNGVEKSYLQSTGYTGAHLVLSNGCDFNFWDEGNQNANKHDQRQSREKQIVFYQGNISSKINFELLQEIVASMPNWEFWFCGEVVQSENDWQWVYQNHNVKYFGKLHPEEVRELAYQATVGIIPFIESDLIIESSLPLKAFEYVACGLPVVTVPIDSLLLFPQVFNFAQSAQEFITQIHSIAKSRCDADALNMRKQIAKQQDYNQRFDELLWKINDCLTSRQENQVPLKILVLYDLNSIHVNTLKEHLESFSKFSGNDVFYSAATQNSPCSTNLSTFDVVIVHYSVRVNIPDHLSSSYRAALKKSGSFKILFIQDEYDTTETARTWIEDIGIHVVFTCVPQEYIESVYPTSRFSHVEFIQTLTGWVPAHLEKRIKSKSSFERKYGIGYRGRSLPYWYGNLGQEKLMIGKKMRFFCEQRGITADIEWDDQKRIYGEKWYEFLGDCQATLGTESGSNVFDEYGEIRKNIENALEDNPALCYEEIYGKYLVEHEGKIIMNQISPKIFEAIALKTALILFEGTYSGVIEPDIHYIPLKKDFSNIDEVFNKLEDDCYIEKLTNRAYVDVIESGKYGYKEFINNFDYLISLRVYRRQHISPLSKFSIEQISSHLLTELEQSKNQLEQLQNKLQNQLQQSQNQLEQLQYQLQQSQNTIEGMESSKFWKLRTKWIKVKKIFSLGNDVE